MPFRGSTNICFLTQKDLGVLASQASPWPMETLHRDSLEKVDRHRDFCGHFGRRVW